MAKNVYLTGHSHIDAVWLWDMEETKVVCKTTFKRILDILDKRTDFVYMQSSPQFYKWIETEEPELFERIKEHVKDGKWEIVGGMWVESDCNLPSGESLIRQFLYGQLYYLEKFGTTAKTTILPDTFGYAWSLPQIMKKSGIQYFLTSKINWQTSLHFPYNLFNWRGLDGTTILSFASPTVYVNTRYEDVKRHVKMVSKIQEDIHDVFVPYGEGDHGGGLTNEMIEDVYREEDKDINVKYCSIEDYFKRVEDNYSKLPVYDGELYLKTHRGTYSSQGKIKKLNRLAEIKMDEAEKLSVIAENFGLAYPHALLKEQWEKILFHQFHDDLPGSSISEVYQQDERDFKEIFEAIDDQVLKRIEVLKKAIKIDSEDSVLVFNPHGFSVDEEITVQVGDSFDGEVINSEGKLISSSVEEKGGKRFLSFYAKKLPSLGYRVYNIKPVEKKAIMNQKESLIDENKFYQYEIDETTGLFKRLYDKDIGKELLKGKGMQLMLYEDQAPLESAWNMLLGRMEVLKPSRILFVENDSYRTVIQSEYLISVESDKDSIIKIKTIINKLHKAIDFEIEADWNEHYKTLKLAFELATENREYDYEIPYGSISRKVPTDENISAEEKAKWEVSGQKWVSVKLQDHRISLLNDCKYGFDTRDGILKVTLLRSARVPKPLNKTLEKIPQEFTDRGRALMKLRLLTTSDSKMEVSQKALSFNEGPIAVISGKQCGSLPSELSYLELESAHAMVSAVKKSEDQTGTIIRVYETNGQEDDCTLKMNGKVHQAFETDFLEKKQKELNVQSGNLISFMLKPYEIKTIYINGGLNE